MFSKKYIEYFQDSLLLSGFALFFCLKYYHSEFIFQGDVFAVIYLQMLPDLFTLGWDHHSLGYLGWWPIVGQYFPLNILMRSVLRIIGFSPANILFILQIKAVLSLIFLGISFYALYRFLKMSRFSALIGSMIIMFTGFHVHAGVLEFNLFFLNSFAMIPWGIIFLLKANRNNSYIDAGSAGLMIGLSVLGGGNVPMFLILPFFLFIPLVDYPIKSILNTRRMINNALFLACAGVVGVLIGAAIILPSLKYMNLCARDMFISGEFFRGGIYGSVWRNMLYREWWNPFIKFFDHETDYFIGLPVLALFCLGLFSKTQAKGKYWFILIGLFSFSCINYRHLPIFIQKVFQGYFSIQNIRYIARYFMVLEIVIGFFAGVGYDTFLRQISEKRKKALIFSCIVLVASVFYILNAVPFFSGFIFKKQEAALTSVLWITILFPFFLFLILKMERFKVFLSFLIICSIFFVYYYSRPDLPVRLKPTDINYSPVQVNKVFDLYFEHSRAQMQPLIKKEKDKAFRFASLIKRKDIYTIKNFWGPYAGVDIAFEPENDMFTARSLLLYNKTALSPEKNRRKIRADSPLFDLYNIKYIEQLENPGKRLIPTGIKYIYENPDVFDRYFITHGVRNFKSEEALFEGLANATREDLKNNVFLIGSDSISMEPGREFKKGGEFIKILKKAPGKTVLEVQMIKPGYLVASELWFPAWRAKVNGKYQKILKSYGTFWALELKEGLHHVTFEFKDKYAFWGLLITITSFLFCMIILAWKIKNRKFLYSK